MTKKLKGNDVGWVIGLVLLILFGCKTKHLESFNGESANSFELNVRSFGAIPNDDIDDSDAIQAAVDKAIRTGISSIIKLEPGIYNIHKGIILANQSSEGNYKFINLTLSGHVPAFTHEQRFGASTVFHSRTPGFTLAIQNGRNCLIENIVFEGSGLQPNSVKEIFEFTDKEWEGSGKSRTNRYSPHCAIVIDPFHRNIPVKDYYPGYNGFYSNTSNGGTSMLTIRGCSFSRYFIGIANNPTNGVNNGDNIRSENCYVSHCHTFWAAGQTQSRCNSINNVYANSIHTFVSGVEIGNMQGTPPFLSNVNIAGFCKFVFNVNTLFSGVYMEQSYLENIWSLGIALGTTVSFDKCQIQFFIPGNEIYAPPFHLFSAATVNFSNCGIEYFSNCTVLAPIIMRARALQISGGWIEGGVITANGITNEGGEDMHNVFFENVVLKCQGSLAGRTSFVRPIENIANEIFTGGESLKSHDHSVFKNIGNTFQLYHIGDLSFSINHTSKTGSFKIKNTGMLKPGDNIFSTQAVALDDYTAGGYSLSLAMGYVSHIEGEEVFLKNIPEGLKSGILRLYVVEYPVFIPPLWGNIQINNSTITEIISYSDSFYPRKGTRIQMEGIPQGTYVIDSDPANRSITLSNKAVISGQEKFIRNADYVQDIYLERWVPELMPVMIEGATIHLEKPYNSSLRLINTNKAILNTPFKEALKSID